MNHIASFVLLTRPDGITRVLEQLAVFPEVEIVAHDASGKVVFLVEASEEWRIVAIADALRDFPVVHSVSMVEHHADEMSEMLEELA